MNQQNGKFFLSVYFLSALFSLFTPGIHQVFIEQSERFRYGRHGKVNVAYKPKG